MNSDVLLVRGTKSLKGSVSVPGDKSISHRSVLMGALAYGDTTIENYLPGDDCLRTIDCLQKMGVEIVTQGSRVLIRGRGPQGLHEPDDVLDVGNSGTAIRLLLGVVAGVGVYSVLTGDRSIRRRPMGRVVTPLTQMGAKILGRRDGELAPLTVLPGHELRGIRYMSPVASAQVKSAVLLAGLFAGGRTCFIEPAKSRDHTERMLRQFQVEVQENGCEVCVDGGQRLVGTHITVPGDISSAAFLMVAAAIIPGSSVVIRNVGLNPTRTGVIEAMQRMGAKIEILEQRDGSEPVGDVRVKAGSLAGAEIGGEIIPRLIDEIPILAVAAACARGKTVIRDAAELRVKESDRIETMCRELEKFAVKAHPTADGMEIEGTEDLSCPEQVCGHGDHRVAMSLAVLAALATSRGSGRSVYIDGSGAIGTSFPGFTRLMGGLGMDIDWA